MKFPPDRNRYAFQGHLALSQRRVFAVSACLRGCAGLKGLALLASDLPRVMAEPKDLAARLDSEHDLAGRSGLGAANVDGFCLYVFLHRYDGGSVDTRRVAACGMGEFDLRSPLTGVDCMIQSSSMSAGRNACE